MAALATGRSESGKQLYKEQTNKKSRRQHLELLIVRCYLCGCPSRRSGPHNVQVCQPQRPTLQPPLSHKKHGALISVLVATCPGCASIGGVGLTRSPAFRCERRGCQGKPSLSSASLLSPSSLIVTAMDRVALV